MLQEQIIFNPHFLDEDHTFRTGEEIEIEVDESIYLNALWMKEPNAKGLIIYLHGNKGNLRRCIRQAQSLSDDAHDILMPDYRGFGKSDGYNYSEEQLLSDAQKVYDWAKQKYKESQIIVVGYSLGTGVASYLAANNQPTHLALIAPYYSFLDLKDSRFPFIPDFLLKYPLKNHQFLESVKCPITLFHGTNDEIIPFDSSERLQAINPDQIQLVKMKGESHRGSIFNRSIRQQAKNWL